MFRVATFNAGLAVGVLPRVTERLPHVVSALAELDVDLLFVQEFWLDRHWQALRAALSDKLPVALRPEARGARRRPCSHAQLAALQRCAEQHCAGLRDEALARCVVEHCAPLALQLPTDCLNCIASNPEGSLSDILGRCVGESAPEPETEARGGLIAYGGSFGTGLLLRQPALASASIAFEATVNARGALYALIEDALGEAPLHVFAAHLSPGGAEQAPQIERLLSFIEEHAAGAPALLLGDLNITPGSSSFARLTAAGFHSGEPNDPRGTYSGEGLVSGRFGGSGWRLDHVLLRGDGLALKTTRILDQTVSLHVDGHELLSTLSDHAGLLSELTVASAGNGLSR